MANDPTTPFVWGENGQQLSPGAISAKRRIAEALMAQGADYSPVKSWTQGLARMANGLVGGLQMRQADQADADREARTTALLMGNPALGGATPAAMAAAPSPAVSRVAAALASSSPDTTGKIYNNDEPSPLDPPSGADRTNMIATILGEENSPAGQAGVANVIRNRAVSGDYGGDTPSAVVQAPGQFEPWSTQAGRARMATAAADPTQVAPADAAIRGAYGEGGKAPTDPTEGKTMFYAPAAQAALGRPAPSWAQGQGQMLGKTAFYDDNSDQPAAAAPSPGMSRVAAALASSPDNAALPAAAAPTQGYAVPGQDAPAATATPQIPPAQANYIKQLIMNPGTRDAGVAMLAQYKPQVGAPYKDADGNLVQKAADGTVHMLSAADKAPSSVREFEYGQTHPDFVQQQLAKTKAGATRLDNIGNVDMNSGQTYDKQLAEGLGKAHAALSNGVEDAQTRARDIAGMQGAVDAIQKNNGTTGGMGQQQILDLKKSINAGAGALGIDRVFDENDLSDREMLSKLNRQIAGAQAKNAVGSRVTNFEMSNYLKANPGLDTSGTFNQRALGIQAQVEQRNIAVGNAIRNATALAISHGQKIDPVTVQRLITTYDDMHHVADPITGQDLTQSYALPEFQQPGQGTNSSLAVGHETNIGNIKIKRIN